MRCDCTSSLTGGRCPNESRSTKRSARLLLDSARQSAAVALGELAKLVPPGRVAEVVEMADGAARGFAVARWALRVVAIASEVAP